MAWIDRLRAGLARSRAGLTEPILRVLRAATRFDEEILKQLEEILIAGDVGVRMATALISDFAAQINSRLRPDEDPLLVLKQLLKDRLTGCERTIEWCSEGNRTVILVAGVNGSGKTTTIAKLAAHLRDRDPSCPITFAAADTFRAAAIEQLEVWAKQLGTDLIKHRIGADPSAVVFDAVDHVAQRGGVLFIDTAGRLQTKHNLMEELKKIERTVEKKLGRCSDERLLVLDATTGQNGISQAYRFDEAIRLTGILLTKLDGTAKGGVVLAIWDALKVPLLYVGVGENKDDLHAFSAEQFVEALFQM